MYMLKLEKFALPLHMQSWNPCAMAPRDNCLKEGEKDI